ncbi:MAG: hypothetical protein WC582_01165 [Patescibacteria group bacterium]
MIRDNLSLYGGRVALNLAKDIAYFPLWWYSEGLKQLLLKLRDFLVNKERALALFVWIKNIFRPMYSQYDWPGIIISFFVRIFQIIFRGALMIFWLVFSLVILAFWLFLPVLAIYEIIFQIAA